ncbi:MAG: LytR C-terminal domain-containing protein [Mycobacteriales bacterium]
MLDENASPSSEEPNPYPVSPPPDPRRRRLIGSVIAVVAVAAGIGLLVAVNGHSTHKTRHPNSAAHHSPSTHQPSHTPSKKPSSAPPTHSPSAPATSPPGGQPQQNPPPGAASHEPLTVLNNSLIHDLAADAADTFREHGWSVRLVGNVKGRFWETTAYYAPGFEDQAKELQQAFPRITRVLPRYEGLPGHGNLTVVVTKDWLG